jgi:hypothetical protein
MLQYLLVVVLFIHRPFSAPCGHHAHDTEAAALRVRLEAIVKEVEDVEA